MGNSMLRTPENLHEEDWSKDKKTDDLLEDDPRFEVLAQWIQPKTSDKIFECGCGSGYLSSLIKQHSPEVFISGCDISEKALERAKTILNKAYSLNLDNENIPESNESFDRAICSEVLEHLYDPDHCLDELTRILKKSGIIYITVPNVAYFPNRVRLLAGHIPPVINDIRHIRSFTKKKIEEMLNQRGYEIKRVTATGRLNGLAKVSPSFFGRTLIVEAKKK